MRITEELIGYLCDLSRLELSDAEQESAKKDLNDILNYMDKLNEVDTSGMREMSHPFDNTNFFREDAVTNSDRREECLGNAPSRKGDYFKVKRTVE